MSPLRKVSIIAAVPVALAAILFGLACLSPVQTWAARRVLAAQPDMQAELGAVSLGWHSVRVTDLTLTQPGLKLHLPSVEVQIPLIAAIGGQVEIGKLVARDWTIEVTSDATTDQSTPAKSDAESAPLHGLFDALKLPVGLTVDGVDVAGKIQLPAGRANLTLTGGSLAPGKSGAFVLAVEMAPSDPAMETVKVRADITARQLTASTFDQLKLDLTATARGPQVPDGATLRFVLNAERAKDGGETHALQLVGKNGDLLKLDLALPAGSGPVAGNWVVNVSDTDIAPFVLGQPLPAFTATGEGKVSSDIEGQHPDASGRLSLAVDRLQTIAPELATLGALNLTTEFDVSLSGDRLRVRRLTVALAGAEPVLAMETLQGFAYEMTSGKVLPAEPVNDLARIAVTRLPLDWIQPWLPEFKLEGGSAHGEWRLAMKDDAVGVRPVAPLTVNGINLDQAGAPLLRAVDLSVAAGGTYGPAGWQADLLEFAARREGRTLIKLTAKAGQAAGVDQSITFTGSYDSDLQAVIRQPFAPADLAVTDGRIQGDFSGKMSTGLYVEATMGISGLHTALSAVFPDIALTLKATQDEAGHINAEVPVAVIGSGGRRSDALLKARIETTAALTQIIASVNADLLYIEDLQSFSALTSEATKPVAKQPTPTTPTIKKPEPASEPFWAGLGGELTLDIKRVVYAPGVEATNITGVVKIGPDGLSLKDLNALVGATGKLQAAAKVLHDATNAKPYEIQGNVKMTGFDPGPFLRASAPKNPPTLEGIFDLTAALSGRAVEPAALIEDGLGVVELTGTAGTLRALGVKLTNIANLATPAASILGLLGAATGNQDVLKYAAATDVVGQLAAVKFDRINLSASRDLDHNLTIKDLSLDSKWVRLIGGGSIQNKPGVSLFSQPLVIDLQLLAGGKLAQGLNTLKLLGQEADAQGYLPLVEKIRLDGSLDNVGAAQLQRLIERALR